MQDLKSIFTEKYVHWKTRKLFRNMKKTSLELPIKISAVKNVLIILPVNMEYMDAAMLFVRKIRKVFRPWHYMILDIDKIKDEQLNRLRLPRQAFTDELKNNKFDLVLDLNFEPDLRILYLIGLLQIPLRLRLHPLPQNHYNIIVNTDRQNFKNFDSVLQNLQTIFVQ